MFRELLSDTTLRINVLATAAIGTVTNFNLNTVHIVCMILVSCTTVLYTMVKIINELKKHKGDKKNE
jgi:hypothetical protein